MERRPDGASLQNTMDLGRPFTFPRYLNFRLNPPCPLCQRGGELRIRKWSLLAELLYFYLRALEIRYPGLWIQGHF